MTNENIETPVLIAGGGPVGLILSRVLSFHGVPCILAEQRETTTEYPKMDVTNGRSMELFRSIGLADQIRALGCPDDNCHDVVFMTSFTGYEVTRFPYAPPSEMRQRYKEINDGAQPLEPNLRLSQVLLEPFLKAQSEADPLVDVRFGWGLSGFEADDDGVTATLVETATGQEQAVRTAYLAGCDGASSVTRKQLGIELKGDPSVRTAYQIHFRSSDRDVIQHHGQAWHYYNGRRGTVIAQDDKDTWTYQYILWPGMAPEDVDLDAALRELAGTEFDYEILVKNPWTARALIADSYGGGRVFLAGDSAHQYVPTGGYGMNTGLGDAFDLGWKLSAVVNGWGGDRLLESYPLERRPIGERNRARSLFHALNAGKWRQAAGDAFHDASPEGEANRAEVAAAAQEFQRTENESFGIEYGYRYDGSPICVTEDDPAPISDEVDYHPTSWPGARAPSFYLDDGSALLDRFGPEFTLLRLGASPVPADDLIGAARARNVPLSVEDVSEDYVRDLYNRDLVLVRPDGHVAWRGNQDPADPESVIDVVRGV